MDKNISIRNVAKCVALDTEGDLLGIDVKNITIQIT